MPSTPFGLINGGVNYNLNPYAVLPNELADASNIIPTKEGLASPREGITKLNTTATQAATRIGSIHELTLEAGNKLLCTSDTRVLVFNTGTSVFDNVIAGMTDDTRWQWCNFAKKAIGCNGGNDHVQYYDGSAGGDLNATDCPKARCIAEWANRVWCGGDATNVATLTGCKLNDPTDWTDANASSGYFSGNVGDSGDPITGLFGYFDMLLIGKINNIYKMYGTTPTDLSTLSIDPVYTKSGDNIGFTSKWAITLVGNDLLFLDGYTVKALSAVEQFGDVEPSIICDVERISNGAIDKDYLQNSHFFNFKQNGMVVCSVPTGASTYFVFVIDYRWKLRDPTDPLHTGRYAVYPLADITAACLGGRESGTVMDLYFGDHSGFVRKLFDGTNNDDSLNITSHFTKCFDGRRHTPMESADITKYRKHWRNMEGFCEYSSACTLKPYYALDLMDDTQIRASGNYTALDTEDLTTWKGTGTVHKRIGFNGLSGRTLAIKMIHDNVDETFVWHPGEINYSVKSKVEIC